MLLPVSLSFLLLGAGIGFVAGVTPGPILTLVVAETFRGGWSRGAAVAAGPLLADGPIVVVAVFVLAQLPPEVVRGLSLVGGGFLCYLAVTTYLNSRRAQLGAGHGRRVGGGWLQGWLARMLTPNAYLFWFLVGAPLLVQAFEADWLAVPAFLLGYYLTIVGSNVVLALALHRWVTLFSERVYRRLLLCAAVVLAAYGVGMFGRGVSPPDR
ncbi:MAG: LysE family transporter [Chloroflexi bacterium]|nr:LysE family transporter [Chloroflexota bacterium]